MNKSILFFSFLIFNNIYAINFYPFWFSYPDTTQNIIIGYPYGSSSPLTDAERNYCTYKNCIVDGFSYRYNHYDQKLNDYYYSFNSECLDSIHKKLFCLSTFKTNIILNQDISLFSPDSSIIINSDLLNALNMKTPTWTNSTFWEVGKSYYAVGMYQSDHNENDAWKSAEENSLFVLMNAIAVRYYGVKINISENEKSASEVAKSIQLKFHLKNIKIIERWPDTLNNQYYVLINIPKKDVFSPFKRK